MPARPVVAHTLCEFEFLRSQSVISNVEPHPKVSKWVFDFHRPSAMDEQKARLRQLRAAHFYYVADDVPLNIWPDQYGVRHDLRDLSAKDLERCFLKVQADITTLGFPIASEYPDENYLERAQEKFHALLLLYLCKV